MKLPLILLSAATAQECGEPAAVANGSVVRNGNKAANTCNVGFCFNGERTRTINTSCENGSWNELDSDCVPCDECSLPSVGFNMEAKFITGSMDAEISCLEGVIEPGTDKTTKTISCIEGGKWNSDIPTCSMPPIINCEDEYMEAVIDKNMLRAKNWDGTASNIFLSGPGSSLMGLDDVDPNCFSVTDDAGNYVLRINAPFMNQCGTQSDIIGDDYEFSNVVKWRYEGDSMHVVKEANVLDFRCVYRGVFMAGLPHKVKLAINTKTYTDDNGDDFTVSMSVYDQEDFSGLVDNIPILHRGKRYFVDLHLHNSDKGTPYLRHCYGSNNYVSEEELKQKYQMQTASSAVRNMIVNGCPAPMTLVKLENAPNTYQSRFSFMFPKLGRGIADLQFVYLHCEIELMSKGFAPTCDDRLFDQALKRNFNSGPVAGIGQRAGMRPGGVQGKKMCDLPWMKNSNICADQGRKRRSVQSNMSLGFGPLVVPEKEEVAGENSERPTASQLVDVVGEDSQIFASDKEPVDIEIEEIEIVEVVVDDGLNLTEGFRKRRKVLIISCMAVGCFLLFLLSLAVSSRISCGKSTRKSKKISTNVLSSQIQRELSKASNI
jgi:hypothetical protein